jgi:hypothetical protein
VAAFPWFLYNSVLFGLAGRFSKRQLSELQDCLPANAVASLEEDTRVSALMDSMEEAPSPSAMRVSARSPEAFRVANSTTHVHVTRHDPYDSYQERIPTTLWNLDRLDQVREGVWGSSATSNQPNTCFDYILIRRWGVWAQRDLPLDGYFGRYDGNMGEGVHVYGAPLPQKMLPGFGVTGCGSS